MKFEQLAAHLDALMTALEAALNAAPAPARALDFHAAQAEARRLSRAAIISEAPERAVTRQIDRVAMI